MKQYWKLNYNKLLPYEYDTSLFHINSKENIVKTNTKKMQKQMLKIAALYYVSLKDI